MGEKRIFISRELKKDSPFKKQLEAKGFTIVNESLIDFSPVLFQPIFNVDWTFFYSKRAIQYYFFGFEQLGLPPIVTKWATMGPGSAAYLQSIGFESDFTGTGRPLETAKQFASKALGQRVLFPRASQSLQSIQKLLLGKINALDLVVYRNEPKINFEIEPCQVLVFTSPLNVVAYYSKYSIQKAQTLIAIGKSTAKALEAQGIHSYHIPEAPNETALAQLIIKTHA